MTPRLSNNDVVVLITDRIYQKTSRHINKLRMCTQDVSRLVLARVTGFGAGLDVDLVQESVSAILDGTIEEIADRIERELQHGQIFIVALNQSAILPGLALQRALGLEPRAGYYESCDKAQMRRAFSRVPGLSLPFAVVQSAAGVQPASFESQRYVVKPTFGMSSKDVRILESWNDAFIAAVPEPAPAPDEWVPDSVRRHLNLAHSGGRLIEPFIEGTEFSIDGWITGGEIFAIVQHKLSMVYTSFIGDGPTVSPPIHPKDLPEGSSWRGLRASEEDARKLALMALEAIGLREGVFHIEARERTDDGSLHIIEVNPRAPGGSLWRSALLRTGYDLEVADAWIQLGRGKPPNVRPGAECVLHYPYYAHAQGVLRNWGDLENLDALGEIFWLDRVAKKGDRFSESDLREEPYLAFLVASSDSIKTLLERCEEVARLNPPEVR